MTRPKSQKTSHKQSHSRNHKAALNEKPSLRGRSLKGKEKGVLGVKETRGAREGLARREGGKGLPRNHCFRHPAYGGAKVQVTGHRSGHRLQATGHRSGHRSGYRPQVTGHRSGHRSHKKQ